MFDVRGELGDAPVAGGRALGDQLRGVEREIRALEARVVAIITEAERTSAFSKDGHSTIGGWCRALTPWSPAETAARVRVARLAQREPAVADALGGGAVGVGQVRELGRVAKNPRCGDQLGHRCCREATHAARSASLTETGDEFILRANSDRATGAALKEILDQFADDEWHADWDACHTIHGDDATPGKLERTEGQRRFDALAAIFRRAASTPPDGRQPEPLVNLVIDTVTLERLLHPDNDDHIRDPPPRPNDPLRWRTNDPRWWRTDDPRWWRSDTTDETPVPPDDVIAAMIWGRVRRIVIDTNDGTILDVGRRRRLFAGRARDAVLLASTRCTWPGCLRPSSRSQADHRTEHQPLAPRRHRNRTARRVA